MKRAAAALFVALTACTPASSTPATSSAPNHAILLSMSGNGQKESAATSIPQGSQIDYTFDCTKFGFAGNFIVSLVGSDGLPRPVVNTLGLKGKDSTFESEQSGTWFVQVSSECSWTVTVKS